MNFDEDANLDAVLQGWSARQAPTPEQIDKFAEAVHARIADESLIAVANASQSNAPASLRGRWLIYGSALASAIALLLYVVPRPEVAKRHLPGAGPDDTPPFTAQILPQEMNELAVLRDELQLLFPREFAWSMRRGRDVEIGLKSSAAHLEAARMLAVRFVVATRSKAVREWRTIQTIDLLTTDEHVVRSEPLSDKPAAVYLWSYMMPDGKCLIDVELQGVIPDATKVSSSSLESTGAVTEIWRSEKDGIEYRVYQSAELLKDPQTG
jgi:hypothetical protein